MEPCKFIVTPLSPSEEAVGFNLPVLTRAVLHNLRVDIANQRLNLNVDTTDITKFVQQEAELKGQLGILDYILTRAEDIRIEEEVQRSQTTDG